MRSLMEAVSALFLLVTSAANAASWVESVSGPPGSCQLVRGGKTGQLQVLMLLRDQDQITLAKECAVVLAGANNAHTRLTVANSPFEVSGVETAPTVFQNIEAWAVTWYNDQSEQELTQVSAAVRGASIAVFPVLLEPNSPGGNKLLSGTPSLQIRWMGGKPPYAITMTDARGQIVATGTSEAAEEASGAIHRGALKLPELKLADYQVRVQDAQSADSIRLTIVPPSEEPQIAATPLSSDMPENIRQSYRAIFLASQRDWRFQAQQIAAANHLESIEQRLTLGDFPEPPAGAPKTSN